MKTLTLYILLFLPIIGVSQINKKENNYTVYINYPEYSVKTDVTPLLKKIKIKEELTYFWYSSNKIFQTKGGYDGKILNGNYSAFYLSGSLKEKGQFYKGLKEGEWVLWFEDGKIQSVKKWKNGLQDGRYKLYDDKGALILEEHYRKGTLNGTQTLYSENKIVSIKKFKNGTEILPKLKSDPKAPENNAKKKHLFFFNKDKGQNQKETTTEKKSFLKKLRSRIKNHKNKKPEKKPDQKTERTK